MNAWENAPHDPIMDEDEIEARYAKGQAILRQAAEMQNTHKPVVHGWWYRYWPKLAALVGVSIFWLLFWYGASR